MIDVTCSRYTVSDLSHVQRTAIVWCRVLYIFSIMTNCVLCCFIYHFVMYVVLCFVIPSTGKIIFYVSFTSALYLYNGILCCIIHTCWLWPMFLVTLLGGSTESVVIYFSIILIVCSRPTDGWVLKARALTVRSCRASSTKSSRSWRKIDHHFTNRHKHTHTDI